MICPLNKFNLDREGDQDEYIKTCLNCNHTKGNAADVLRNWGSHCQLSIRDNNTKKMDER